MANETAIPRGGSSRILVTGIDGFTGRYLAEALIEQGHEVHGLVRPSAGEYQRPSVTIHSCDLDDQAGLNALMSAVRPDRIVHLAAISFVAHSNVDEIYETNLLGTRHLLEAAATAGHALGAILLASSANIYGNSQAGSLDETTPPDPVNDYAVSKLAMEQMARLYRSRLPIIVVRPFNYTGVGQSTRFLVPKIVDHVRRRTPVIELGNIDVERDWSDVRDVVDSYVRLLNAPAAIGQTVNICSGEARSLREILDLACRLAGHEMEVRVNPAFVRPDEVRSLKGRTERLNSIVGTRRRHPIEETLEWMLTAS